jgi:hypothetical protein
MGSFEDDDDDDFFLRSNVYYNSKTMHKLIGQFVKY